MKIVYLSGAVIPSRFAHAINMVKMCEAFARKGHDVTMVIRRSRVKTKDIYDYYGVEKNFNIKDIRYFENIEQKNDLPDLFYGRAASWLLRVSSLGIPMIFEAHEVPSQKVIEPIGKLLSYKNFKRLVVITSALGQEYRRLYPWFAEEKIKIAYSAANKPTSIEQGFRISKPGESLNIGYIGHLYAGKGMEVIIPLAKRLPEDIIHVVGGREEDIRYWKKYSCNDNIIFHGYVPYGQLEQYYNMMDIALVPNQYKVFLKNRKTDIGKWTSPMKLFDYMAYSKAIIASDVPVLREVLSHEENCLLCPPDNIQQWVEAVLRLKNDVALRKKLAETAYKDFINHYTWEKRAETVIA